MNAVSINGVVEVKISVITAVYNNSDHMLEAIRSVKSQKGVDIEFIVIDGGSKDGTLEIIEQNRGSIDIVVSESDHGIYDALNKGLRLATGDVVGFLHSDDLFVDDDVLSKIANRLADANVCAVYGDLVYVRQRDTKKIVRYWCAGEFSRRKLAWGWMPPHPTFYVRRSVYEEFGGFNLRYKIASDYDAMLRYLGSERIQVAYIPEVLVKMRLGGTSNRSLKNILRKSCEDYLVLRNNGVGGIGALTWKNLCKVTQFFVRQSRMTSRKIDQEK